MENSSLFPESKDPASPREGSDSDVTDSSASDAGKDSFDIAMLRDMLDTSPVGFYVNDPGTDDVLFFNEGFVRMWHLEAARNALRSGTLKNSDIRSYLAQETADSPAFLGIWDPLQDRGNTTIACKEMRLRDGSLIELFSTPFKDSHGKDNGRLFIFEDITRKRATVELEAVNERLQAEIETRNALFNTLQEKESMLARAEHLAHLGSWMIDIRNRKAVYSDEVARIFEIPVTGKADFDLVLTSVHPDDRDRLVAWTKASIKKRTQDHIDFRLSRKNGLVRHVRCEIEYEIDAAGQHARMFGVAQDVTESVEARARMKRQAETETLLLEVSRQMTNLRSEDLDVEINAVLKRLGQFVRADRSFVFMLSTDGAIMDNTHEWCAEGFEERREGLQGIKARELPWLFQRLKMFGAVNVPDVAAMPDAAGRWREMINADHVRSIIIVPMIYSGTLIGLIGFEAIKEARTWFPGDITMLKQAGSMLTGALIRRGGEIALVESEARLRLITNTVDFPMLICEGERIIYANEAATHITGYSVPELQSHRLVDIIHPDDRALVLRRLHDRLKGQAVPSQYEVKLLRKDGSDRWIELLVERGMLKGKPVVIIAGTDITDRKNEELDLRKQLAERDALIEKLTAAKKPARTDKKPNKKQSTGWTGDQL